MWKKQKIKPTPSPDLPKTPEHDLFEYLGDRVTKQEAGQHHYLVPCPIHNKQHKAIAYKHLAGPQTWICVEETPLVGGTLDDYLKYEAN